MTAQSKQDELAIKQFKALVDTYNALTPEQRQKVLDALPSVGTPTNKQWAKAIKKACTNPPSVS